MGFSLFHLLSKLFQTPPQRAALALNKKGLDLRSRGSLDEAIAALDQAISLVEGRTSA